MRLPQRLLIGLRNTFIRLGDLMDCDVGRSAVTSMTPGFFLIVMPRFDELGGAEVPNKRRQFAELRRKF